jgi:plastocyanin
MTHRWKSAVFGLAGAILVLAARPAQRAQTVNVQMIGDAKGNRFVPATITIHVGDVVTWTNVSGAHNVVFWPDSIPAGTQTGLQGKMGATMGPLMGPMFAAPNATYTVSFAGLKAGTYKYYCLPHLALGMRAQIVVQP